MKKGVLSVLFLAGLGFACFSATEAKASHPYVVRVGTPRVSLSIGSGYGAYGGYYSPAPYVYNVYPVGQHYHYGGYAPGYGCRGPYPRPYAKPFRGYYHR